KGMAWGQSRARRGWARPGSSGRITGAPVRPVFIGHPAVDLSAVVILSVAGGHLAAVGPRGLPGRGRGPAGRAGALPGVQCPQRGGRRPASPAAGGGGGGAWFTKGNGPGRPSQFSWAGRATARTHPPRETRGSQ